MDERQEPIKESGFRHSFFYGGPVPAYGVGMGAASYPLFLRGILSARERSGEGGLLEQTSDHHD